MGKKKKHGNTGKRNALKPKELRATHPYNLRITEYEWQIMNEAAELEDVKLSIMVRQLITEHCEQVLKKHDRM